MLVKAYFLLREAVGWWEVIYAVHDEGGLDGGYTGVSYLSGEVELCISVVCIDGAAVDFVVDGEFFVVWEVWWDVVYPWVQDGGREVPVKTVEGVV